MDQLNQIKETVLASCLKIIDPLMLYIPRLVGALIILIIGFIIAKMARKAIRQLLSKVGLDGLGDKLGLHSMLMDFGVNTQVSRILSSFAYYCFILIILIIASDILKFEKLTQGIEAIVLYLPNVFAGLLILMIGAMVAQLLRGAIVAASDRAKFEFGFFCSKIVYFIFLIVTVIIALGQLQLNTALLNQIFQIIIIAFAIAIALSVGLGTRDLTKKIVSSIYVREQFPVGAIVEIEGIKGSVEAVTATYTKVKLENNKMIHFPNNEMLELRIIETE